MSVQFEIRTDRLFLRTFDEDDLMTNKLDLIQTGVGRYHLLDGTTGHSIEIEALDKAAKTVSFKLNGKVYAVKIRSAKELLLEKLGIKASEIKTQLELRAPMPGLVLKVVGQPGDQIKKGDSILFLEAMKMENNIKAAGRAVIKRLLVAAGDKVEKNQVLAEFEPLSEEL